ncbi:hypothetical protein RUM43_013503 [Polyplax serrata]|uniref:Uncharacterized protein n=1 Tax=Polyplax serrata TaxID=468196 RepID=A0AAN8PJ73_POLSC
MEALKLQFDSALGGPHAVPDMQNISTFLKQRMEEIVMLTEAVKEVPFRGQTFQRLPKHMRRRQMSHHVKRLPRRLQRPYILTLNDGLPDPTKRPSRKYRRRPRNLLEEYNRRQRCQIWLESHIWHAKRFHMVPKWGYKLADSPTNKSFRACYRALSEHCLLIDISYLNCIQLKGPEEKLLDGLQQCTSFECGLTFGSKLYLGGAKEGSIPFFHPNCYPYKIIGYVTFMWKRLDENDTDRSIWIWVHPLIHDEIVECLKNLFNLNLLKAVKDEEQHLNQDIATGLISEKREYRKEKKSKKRMEQVKLEPKNVPIDKTTQYVSDDKLITLVLLRDTLNRFQLTGPLSQAIISQAFNLIPVCQPKDPRNELNQTGSSDEVHILEVRNRKRKLCEVEVIDEPNKKMKSEQSITDDNIVQEKTNWWVKYYKNESAQQNWQHQKELYEKLSNCLNPTDVPQQFVLPLIISDPRITIPNKRYKATPVIKEPCQIKEGSCEEGLHQSPIWDENIRDEVSMTKLTTEEINEAKSRKIVPGYDTNDVIPDEKQSRIPILLVQRPGVVDHKSGRIGLGSGWDIISPAGYGMPIWRALVFRGARPGGLRETELLQLECSSLNGQLQPDSFTGKREVDSSSEDLKTRYFKLPPKQRPNFIKLGVPSPFRCPWELLVADWIKATGAKDVTRIGQTFFVLRSRQSLHELCNIMSNVNMEGLNSFVERTGKDCLVPIQVVCSGKGKPKDLAMICIPKAEDLKNPPMEPTHLDDNEKLRKTVRYEHVRLLKRLRRKRRKERLKLKENFINNLPEKLTGNDILKSNVAPSKDHSEEFKIKMEALWLPQPEQMDSIIDFPSRQIIGFVVKGNFTYSKSVCTALGYVTLLGLIELIKIHKENEGKFSALIRNRDETHYKLGIIRINRE